MNPFSIKEYTILVVEDEEPIRQVIQRTLEEFGFKSLGAGDGKEAQAMIGNGQLWSDGGLPDLILSDVMMPRMDGFTLCEQVKQDPKTRAIPFIFLTVRSGVADRALGFLLGCQRYLAKPFRKVDLLHAINQWLIDAAQTRALLAEHSGKVEGDLTQVSIQSLVDQFLIGEKSGSLVVSRRGIEGRVDFIEGRISNVDWGRSKDQEALTSILCLTEGEFRAERT